MAQSRVTKQGAYAEIEGQSVAVTKMGAYAEIVTGSQIRATQMGAYIEMVAPIVSVTQMGAYIEIIPTTPPLNLHHEYNPGPPVYEILPEPLTGYALDGPGSFWSAVVPEATENTIIDPSFENGEFLSNTYYYDGWASVEFTTEKATSGFYSLKLTPNGIDNGQINYRFGYTTGEAQTFSLDVWQTVGDSYEIQAYKYDYGPIRGRRAWRAKYTGWVRMAVTFPVQDGGQTILYFISHAGNSGVVYTDSWQLEGKGYPTTYCDGAQQGFGEETDPYAYSWRGKPHASKSYRSANTRSGGRYHSFEEAKFRTIGIQGLGMGPVDPQFEVLDPGERLTHVGRPGRDFTIIGKLLACKYLSLQERRQMLISWLRPRWLRDTQPLILTYHDVDSRGVPDSPQLYVKAIYREGMGLSLNNLHQETLTLAMRATDPLIYERGGEGAELAYQNQGSGNVIWVREDGNWTPVIETEEADAQINAVCYLGNGSVIIGGEFTLMGANTRNYCAAYVPELATSWSGFGALNGAVNDIAPGTGQYKDVAMLVGDFTLSGVATCPRVIFGVVQYALLSPGSSWTSNSIIPANGLNANALCVASWRNGEFIVGGEFTRDSNNTMDLGHIAFWIPSAPPSAAGDWSPLSGDGLDGTVRTIIVGPDGYAYAGGDFTGLYGIPTTGYNRVVKISPAGSISAMGRGLNNTVRALAFGPDGYLYAGGDFTQDGYSITQLRYLARWNGIAWEEVGGGLESPVTALHNDGEFLWVSGGLNPVETSDPFYFRIPWQRRWTGDQFIKPEFYGSKILDYAQSPDGRLFVATTATAQPIVAAASTVVVNPGTAEVRPILRLSGLDNADLLQVSNLTTGQHLMVDALEMFSEEIYLDFTGEVPRFYTTGRTDVATYFQMMGGDARDFRLVEGENVIQIFIRTDSEDMQSLIRWRNGHWSTDAMALLT